MLTIKKIALICLLPSCFSVRAMEFPLQIEEFVDRALRLKVTNTCSLTCSFCHNEGTEPPSNTQRTSTLLDVSLLTYLPPVESVNVPDIEDAAPPCKHPFLRQLECYRKLGFNQIHLTGGEPSSHPNLARLISLLTKNQFQVKMTSNGQFSDDVLRESNKAGLQDITFSVLSLDPKGFLQTQLRQYRSQKEALSAARLAIETLKSNIIKAKELGMRVKLNVVVLGQDDTPRVDQIVEFAKQNAVIINLLPSVLSTDPTASEKTKMEQLAFEYALRHGAQYVKTMQPVNNSGGTHHLVLPDQTEIRVKYIRDNQPAVLCSGSVNMLGKQPAQKIFMALESNFMMANLL